MRFEIVHTMTDYWDGPRGGIADYQGSPHLYQSQFDETDEEPDTFLLSPCASRLFAYALEDWNIWRRWESAFHQKQTSIETHPALPAERARHEELKALLAGRLVIDPAKAIKATAKFQKREDPTWDGFGWAPIEVCWTLLP
jgi:hypothetical protein